MPLTPTSSSLSTRAVTAKPEDQRARPSDAERTLGKTGLLVFNELLNIMGSTPVYPLVYWASALRTEFVLKPRPTPTSKDSPAQIKHRELQAKAEKMRIASKVAPKTSGPPFKPPFKNTLPRVAGWCRVLDHRKTKLPDTPGLAFSIRTVTATGKTRSGEPWAAPIVFIYEHKTGSLFHYAPTDSIRAPFNEGRLRICLEKAIYLLRKNSRNFPTIPPELMEAPRTVFLTPMKTQSPLANVYEDEQKWSGEHLNPASKQSFQKAKGTLVHLDPKDWQIVRSVACATQIYATQQDCKEHLMRVLASHAHSATTKLRHFHRDEARLQKAKAENSPAPNSKPRKTFKSKQQTSPHYLRYSWRALVRIR